MRVDHLPNKRDATGAGRYPGPRYGMRGLMSSSYYAREQLAQRGGTREREGRGPQAKGGATLARMARACRTAATPVLCVACVVWWPVVGASPSRTGGRRSRCGATGQRLDPPVVFVSLSGEWGGCRSARAVCAERCWRPGRSLLNEDRSRTDCTGSSDVDYNTIVRGQRTEMYPTVSMDRITSRIQFQLVQGRSTATHTAPVNHRPGSWVSEAQLSVGPLKLVSAKARAARLSARHDATAAAAPEAAGAER